MKSEDFTFSCRGNVRNPAECELYKKLNAIRRQWQIENPDRLTDGTVKQGLVWGDEQFEEFRALGVL